MNTDFSQPFNPEAYAPSGKADMRFRRYVEKVCHGSMASSFLSFSAFAYTLMRKKHFSGYKNSTSSCRTVLSIIRSRHIRAAHCNGQPVSSRSFFITRLSEQPFS